MDKKDKSERTSGPLKVTIVGIPFDEYSSFKKGAAGGPAKIREAFNSDATNKFSEGNIDLANEEFITDMGDIKINDFLNDIEKGIISVLDYDTGIISLGGDHSVTYPIIRAFSKKYPELNILHLDAHPDLYHEFQSNPFSHACPFARIMEEGLAKRLVQVGIRSATNHLREQAEKFNVEIIEIKNWDPEFDLLFEGPMYLSLDLDVLDPAFAPGVSHHEPGGLSSRDVIKIIQSINVPLVGADIVELNPLLDQSGITAAAAAKFLKEIAGKMIGEI